MLDEANALERAIDRKIAKAVGKRTRTTGTVTRIDVDGTVYVQVEGADSDTPVSRSTASVAPGDTVSVRIENGSAAIEGNATDPSAGTSRVLLVEGKADTAIADAARAHGAADAAEADAARAKDAADSAQESADAAQADATRANTYSNAALDQLSVVQDVAGILTWASEQGAFVRTSDTAVVDGKVYFTFDGADYTPVVEPDAAQLPAYYELDMSGSKQAMNEYILAHLAVTSRGLWVLPSGTASTDQPVEAVDDATGSDTQAEKQANANARKGDDYKLLLSSSGTYIYDGSGQQVALYGPTGIVYADGKSWHVGSNDAYILYTPASGSTPAHITIGGSNIMLGDSRTLAELLEQVDAAPITASDFGKREIVTEDAAELPLLTLTAYGESVQDGTPSPGSPVPVKSVRSVITTGEHAGCIAVVSADSTETHTTYIDLDGNELHGIGEVRDVLSVDASGHAVITKRMTSTTEAATLGIDPPVYMSTTGDLRDGATVIYPADEATVIDLGMVTLPDAVDGGTVEVVAEVQPLIDASWWTKAGYEAGKAHLESIGLASSAHLAAEEAQATADGIVVPANFSDLVNDIGLVDSTFVPPSVPVVNLDGLLSVDQIDVDSLRVALLQAAGLLIGERGGVYIETTGSHMAFKVGEQEVAYIDVDPSTNEAVFYMTRSIVVKDMQFGGGKWKWYKRSNNNMSLKWMG